MKSIRTHWIAIAAGAFLFFVGIAVGASGAGQGHENGSHRAKEPALVMVTVVKTVREPSSGTFLADTR